MVLYGALGGNSQEIRVVLLNHGEEILNGDINSHLREIAEGKLQKRTVPIEMLIGAEATAIRTNSVEYKQNGKSETLAAATTIWTTGTSVHPLIKDLAVPNEHRDKRGRLLVTPTLQLLDFTEAFAGGDCAVVQNSSHPDIAQVAYQQGAAIAYNLKAIALGNELKQAKVNLRGTLLKLGLDHAAASVYNVFEVKGEIAHLIRQGTYLELLLTPSHNFKATTEWLNEEIFHDHINPNNVDKTVVRTA